SHFGRLAVGCDVLRHRVELSSRASCQEDSRPLAREGPSQAATDPTAAAVDDRRLAFQEICHMDLLCIVVADACEVKRRLSRKLIGRAMRRLGPGAATDARDLVVPPEVPP